ncbi:MAG: CAAX amino terminal protease self- immunity [Firmicutes bacterium ADurb.Bin182]|nr:MAG: CAAX amino terminal protease self- immunity [Firmicutes bacterium ADurb.Bin182]
MKKISAVSIIALIAMTAVSFANLFGMPAAGIGVIIGVVFFFINKAVEKQPFSESGLDIKTVGSGLKRKAVWFWMLTPILANAACIMIAMLFIPEFIPHVISRVTSLVSFDKVSSLFVQFIVLALGEEIAWRAFFQKQLLKVMPLAPALIIAAFLFGIGHFEQGDPVIAAFDVFFVAVNGVLYGIIFHKTDNAWVSAIAHFAANVFGFLVLIPFM